jgi:hypothetical protein
MSGHDTEIQQLKASVSCAALLERLPLTSGRQVPAFHNRA